VALAARAAGAVRPLTSALFQFGTPTARGADATARGPPRASSPGPRADSQPPGHRQGCPYISSRIRSSYRCGSGAFGSLADAPSKATTGDSMTTNRTLRAAIACALALGTTAGLQAQTLKDLTDDQATTGDVLTYGMGYANQRYSPLKAINKGNVDKLTPVWTYSLNNPQGQESQPIIHNGVMYVTTHTSTVAVDALTGRQIWKQDLEFASDVFKMACCGLLNRGAAIYNGKIYRTTLDAHVIAYDAKTGKQLWKSKAADY
jgi:hypothetical protein